MNDLKGSSEVPIRVQHLKDFSLQLLTIIRKSLHILAPLEIPSLSSTGIVSPFISLFYFYYIHCIYPFLLYIWSSKNLECNCGSSTKDISSYPVMFVTAKYSDIHFCTHSKIDNCLQLSHSS